MVESYYRAICDLSQKLQVACADLENHWRNSELALSCPQSRLFQFDGVHPTDLGHEIMAEGLLRAFGF